MNEKKTWTVSVGIRVSIDYDDIEADSREEAVLIAKERALEDVEINNCDYIDEDDLCIYCAYENDEEEDEE